MVWLVVTNLIVVLRIFCTRITLALVQGHTFWTGLPSNETNRRGPAFNILAIQNAGWEHVKKLDIGFDMSLFNQLNITFDYFHDHRDRILMSRASWPTMLGYWGSLPWSNIGEVVNRGVELSVNWNKHLGKTGTWIFVVTLLTTRMNTNM